MIRAAPSNRHARSKAQLSRSSGVEATALRCAICANGSTWVFSPVPNEDALPGEQKRLFDAVRRSEGSIVRPSPAEKTYTADKRRSVLVTLAEVIVVAHANTTRARCLATAAKALSAGKPVWVVPPMPSFPQAEGTRALMRRPNVRVLWRSSELLASISLAKHVIHVRRENPTEQLIVNALTTPLHHDQLAERTGLTIPQLASGLFQLQVEGIVRQRMDGCFELA